MVPHIFTLLGRTWLWAWTFGFLLLEFQSVCGICTTLRPMSRWVVPDCAFVTQSYRKKASSDNATVERTRLCLTWCQIGYHWR